MDAGRGVDSYFVVKVDAVFVRLQKEVSADSATHWKYGTYNEAGCRDYDKGSWK